MVRPGFVACVGWLLAWCPLLCLAGDWRQFRGPEGQGHAETNEAPIRWSESENIAWKVPVEGGGWSSPVVLGDQVWLTTAIETPGSAADLDAALERVGMPVPSPRVAGRVQLMAVCFDRDSGRLLHKAKLFDVDEPVILCAVNSYASPTPAAEAGRLYCDFGAMGTACLNTETGEIVWTRQLMIEHQVGPGSSPILYGDLLVLTRDGCDQQYVTALDKRTGKTVWKTDRPTLSTKVLPFRKAFSTPLVFAYNGGEQMVVPGAQWIVSYEPASGRELWRVDTGPTFSNSSSPSFSDGLVFCTTAYGGTYLVAIRPDGAGDTTDSHVAWQTQRSVPRMPSPLALGDELYMVSDSGVVSCLDAESGDIHWSERLGGKFSASPVAAAGRVYCFSEEGDAHVIAADKEFAPVAENSLDGTIKGTPAFVDGVIILRTDSHLYRIGSS